LSVTPAFWARRGPTALALLPLGLLFRLVVQVRRLIHQRGWREVVRLPVPVVVVGNITVGGTGKTPVVIALARALVARGLRPGIVTRGYGGRAGGIGAVTPDSDPLAVGDEPVLLASRSGCPVWRGADRVAAATALLAAHPDCDCLISDDGLQHLRLGRDVEIAVVDGARGFGNGLPLPAGPLREPPARLRAVDAVIINGTGASSLPPGMPLTLEGSRLVNLARSDTVTPLADWQGRRVHGVAGIGNPHRFFEQLRAAGLQVEEHPFPDHHPFAASDLAFEASMPVVMTEKDAVKCMRFAREDWWYLPVEARLEPALFDRVAACLTRGGTRAPRAAS
jgi:tetraacyldisaccharide 4'-kinase